MSLTMSQPLGQPLSDEPRPPTDVFPELLERNGDVCRRCYTRIKDREPYPWTKGQDHGDRFAFVEQIEDGRLGAFVERTQLPDRTDRAHPPDERADSGTTACRCGAIETHRTPPTRSSEDAVWAAAGISATLTELDVVHDWLFLISRVRALKSKPAFAGNDFRTFKTATAEAVRVARTGSPSPN